MTEIKSKDDRLEECKTNHREAVGSVFKALIECRDALETENNNPFRDGRALALTCTKLDEAAMWFRAYAEATEANFSGAA